MTRNKKNRILFEEQEYDGETGEITRRKTTLQFSKEPAYVKLYFDCLGVYIKNDGLNESLNDMLLEVLKLGTYADEEQTVTLVAYQKERICKKTGKSIARLEQAITTWVKNKILIRIARGTYRINPWIFGKGDWRDICNLRANFDFKNGQVIVEREYERDKAKEKTASDVLQLPKTIETTDAGENVPVEEEKPQNEPKFAELPLLVGYEGKNFESIRQVAITQRDKFFRQFTEQIPLFENPKFTEKMREIFQNENDTEFWVYTEKTTFENLLPFHEEWKAKQDKNQ